MKMPGPGDYTIHDPRGWCGDPRRGAALGRAAYHADDPCAWRDSLYVSRVPIDSGGYDPNGTYFGCGDPIYWARNKDCTVDFVFRAQDRAAAIVEVRGRYPHAKIRGAPKAVAAML